MPNCIKIQGFKCFQEAEIQFSNFTLLAGKNSAGKSTVIQAVLALYQRCDTYGIGSNLSSFSGIAGGDRDTMVQPDLGWNGADNNKIIFFCIL